MISITLGLNALDKATWERFEEESLEAFLLRTFGAVAPPGLRIFHESVSPETDVTPRVWRDGHGKMAIDEDAVERLHQSPGPFYVIVYPTSPAQLIVSFALLMVSVGLSFLFPKDKQDPTQAPKQGSANNTLGNRQNQTRLLGRVPDIYGTVRATPDLIAIPWVFYNNNQETEVCAMCLGRGHYEVNPFNIFEGDMRGQTIQGLSVEIYDPGVLPGVGSPVTSIGAPIGFKVYNVYQAEGVIGQVAFARNAFAVHGAIPFPEPTPEVDNVFGVVYNLVQYDYFGGSDGRAYVPLHDTDVTEVTIAVGDIVELRMEPSTLTRLVVGNRPKTHGMIDQSGFVGSPVDISDNNAGYPVVAINLVTIGVAPYAEISFNIPSSRQADWAAFAAYASGHNIGAAAALLTPLRATTTTYKNTIGPFFVDDPTMTSVNCNIVAEQGLFVDDTKNTQAIDITFTVTITPANVSGVASGPAEEFNFTLKGSSTDRTTRAITAVCVPTFTGRCLVQVINTSLALWRVDDPGLAGLGNSGLSSYPASDWNSAIKYVSVTGIVKDEVKWTHCYSFSDPPVTDFGDTTLVMAQTIASKATNLVKDRKLSMFATRRLQTWNGTSFGGPLASTEFPEDMFFSILKDPQLANMDDADIDFFLIANAFQGTRNYFGDNVTRFGHTFDSESTTIEDMLTAIAESCFCTVYREGQIVRVKQDSSNVQASLLFNHRNIVQTSQQTITVNFGTDADYDGVKVDYFDDASNTIKSVVVPNNNAIRPRDVQIPGVRDTLRAYFHAWRAYYHILYQNTVVEFEACQEAALALFNDVVLVADVTRADRQEGELTFVGGTTVRTSQPVSLVGGASYTLFVQHDFGIENIAVVSSPDSRTLVLASAPGGLVTDAKLGVPAFYLLVKNSDTRPTAFMIDSKTTQGKMTWQLQAHNFSHGYYFADGLQLWLAPKVNNSLDDVSPYGRIFTDNGVAIITDPARGAVVTSGTSNHILADSAPDTDTLIGYTDYTKALWLQKQATGTSATFLSLTSPANEELLFISSGDTINVVHHGVTYASFPGFILADWHHIGVTFDSSAGLLRLFIDGILQVEALGVPQPSTRSGFIVVNGLLGQVDDMRLYRRAFSVDEMFELYQKTNM